MANLKWSWGCEGLRSYRRSLTRITCEWYLVNASESSVQCVELGLHSYVMILADRAQIS